MEANVGPTPGEVVSTRVLTIPNLISFARLCLVPVFLWAYLVGRVLPALILLFVIGSSDFVDGYVARATGQVSVLGKLLDPVADRIVIVAVLIAFAANGDVPWVLAAVVVARDLIVAVAFGILEKRGMPRLPVNRTGKRATAALFTGFGFVAGSVLLRVSGVAELRSDAHVVHTVGIVLLVVGAVLYWAAGGLYAVEMRRQFAGGEAGGTS